MYTPIHSTLQVNVANAWEYSSAEKPPSLFYRLLSMHLHLGCVLASSSVLSDENLEGLSHVFTFMVLEILSRKEGAVFQVEGEAISAE